MTAKRKNATTPAGQMENGAAAITPVSRLMEALAEADKEAADPNTPLLCHDEIRAKLREKYGI